MINRSIIKEELLAVKAGKGKPLPDKADLFDFLEEKGLIKLIDADYLLGNTYKITDEGISYIRFVSNLEFDEDVYEYLRGDHRLWDTYFY